MFYRLVQGGTIPSWYGTDAPVTYILEPGLFQDPALSAKWQALRTADPGLSYDAICNRVEGILTAYYTNPQRGFAQLAPPDPAAGWYFRTLGRLVAAAQAAPARGLACGGGWVACGAADAGAGAS